jgi:hypothetical protein
MGIKNEGKLSSIFKNYKKIVVSDILIMETLCYQSHLQENMELSTQIR